MSSQYKLHIFLVGLIIIGSINYGTSLLGCNMIKYLSNFMNNLFKSSLYLDKIIYFSIAVGSIYLAFKRDTWLPFLGNSVLPGAVIPLSQPTNTNMIVKIKTLPNVKIVYWAALNKGDSTNVYLAYNNYENSGVVMSDKNGDASLPIMVGSGYTLPNGKVLPRHVHYRILDYSDNKGMMSKIETINY